MTKNRKTGSFTNNPHLIVGLCKPFIDGARLQVERLLAAQQMLKHDPLNAVYRCHHETSNLFEDLATIVQYLNLCAINMKDDQLYKDVRDLIRHDVREEFDNDEKRKRERAERLGMNPKLQFGISYDIGDIKVGGTTILLKDISNYINLAEQTVNALLLGLKVETAHGSKEEEWSRRFY